MDIDTAPVFGFNRFGFNTLRRMDITPAKIIEITPQTINPAKALPAITPHK